jgi:PleD family two-component response regulator
MGDRPEEMLARADQALYTSKRTTKKPMPDTKPKVKLKA